MTLSTYILFAKIKILTKGTHLLLRVKVVDRTKIRESISCKKRKMTLSTYILFAKMKILTTGTNLLLRVKIIERFIIVNK